MTRRRLLFYSTDTTERTDDLLAIRRLINVTEATDEELCRAWKLFSEDACASWLLVHADSCAHFEKWLESPPY